MVTAVAYNTRDTANRNWTVVYCFHAGVISCTLVDRRSTKQPADRSESSLAENGLESEQLDFGWSKADLWPDVHPLLVDVNDTKANIAAAGRQRSFLRR